MKSIFSISIICIFMSLLASDKNSPIQIGPEEQLFLDDYIIESMEHITRRINQVKKHADGPVLKPDKKWEGSRAFLFGRVIYDYEDRIYKMWYYCDGGHVAYATSHDGIIWEKPQLDVVIHDGQKTNLVMERGNLGYFYENFGVIKDKNDPNPNRRYKVGFVSIQREYSGENEDRFNGGQRRGLGIAVSPDGIHWTLENEFASYEICDISHFFWDSSINKYVLYGRTKLTSDQLNNQWKKWGWGRAVIRIESSDFLNWSRGKLVLAADSDDPDGTEIYSMSVFPYQGLYIGCVQMFYGLTHQGNLDIQLAVSRNGKQFNRVEPREPLISEGRVGEWDRFNISIGDLPPIQIEDELWFYYSGRTYRHGPYDGEDTGPKYGAIGLAKIKRGRFVSLEASFDGGKIITKLLSFTSMNLFINADTRYGLINISILDENSNLIPGYQCAISGEDRIDMRVQFREKSLKDLSGRSIRIQFNVTNSRLFGFYIR
jgi:hypothetical protein